MKHKPFAKIGEILAVAVQIVRLILATAAEIVNEGTLERIDAEARRIAEAGKEKLAEFKKES